MAITKTASKTKKPVSKKPAGTRTQRKAGIRKGTKFSCEICGLIVSVDEVCGCIETCDIICCGEQMTRKK
ncbi:MAG: hypothetical protein ACOYVJ_10530 [Nitrospirota bacterium]